MTCLLVFWGFFLAWHFCIHTAQPLIQPNWASLQYGDCPELPQLHKICPSVELWHLILPVKWSKSILSRQEPFKQVVTQMYSEWTSYLLSAFSNSLQIFQYLQWLFLSLIRIGTYMYTVISWQFLCMYW